jgi:hypothetical protein
MPTSQDHCYTTPTVARINNFELRHQEELGWMVESIVKHNQGTCEHEANLS